MANDRVVLQALGFHRLLEQLCPARRQASRLCALLAWRAKACMASLLVLMGCFSSSLAGQTGTDSPTPETATQPAPALSVPLLRYLLHGIIENAHWPSTAASHVRICLAGNPALLDELQTHPLQSRHGTAAIQAIDWRDKNFALQDCSVLYIGEQTPEDMVLHQVLSLHKIPIITIRENPKQCNDGIMICLYTSASKVPTFDINLDAVARSGVLLDPKVLTLTNRLPSGLLPTAMAPRSTHSSP